MEITWFCHPLFVVVCLGEYSNKIHFLAFVCLFPTLNWLIWCDACATVIYTDSWNSSRKTFPSREEEGDQWASHQFRDSIVQLNLKQTMLVGRCWADVNLWICLHEKCYNIDKCWQMLYNNNNVTLK